MNQKGESMEDAIHIEGELSPEVTALIESSQELMHKLVMEDNRDGVQELLAVRNSLMTGKPSAEEMKKAQETFDRLSVIK